MARRTSNRRTAAVGLAAFAVGCASARGPRSNDDAAPGDGQTATGSPHGSSSTAVDDGDGDGPDGDGGDDTRGTSDGTTASGSAGAESSGGAIGSSTGGAVDLPPGPLIGAFQLTYYWLADESEYPGTPTHALYDPECSVLATVTPDFASAIALEGTGRLQDGRLLNVHSACDCPNSPCFFEADEDHPWGYGVQNRALRPFRSIAIDDRVLTIGTAYYVQQLDGVPMPGEAPWGAFVHDGCVVADDVGGGIVGEHIDFFAALQQHYETLDGRLAVDSIDLHEGGDRCAALRD